MCSLIFSYLKCIQTSCVGFTLTENENSWESKDSDEIKRDIHDPDKTLVKTEDSTIGVTVNVILTILSNT